MLAFPFTRNYSCWHFHLQETTVAKHARHSLAKKKKRKRKQQDRHTKQTRVFSFFYQTKFKQNRHTNRTDTDRHRLLRIVRPGITHAKILKQTMYSAKFWKQIYGVQILKKNSGKTMYVQRLDLWEYSVLTCATHRLLRDKEKQRKRKNIVLHVGTGSVGRGAQGQ